ncbi:acyl-CoA dehydrogenase family protein [Amycolatopsis sp. K13G38]|uniref:Acyl-CoA dehydrogenase family protein n=1 Tax=Amycolatopsis acididurans TaxID=2724524 RepID=A0ABX1JI17_9PSEU|nr:acyl-CoA dehydrogenase family protein [Amycolatopsis acididurans]NKQ58045.1 acyl-CoA dehydrogenase family protein [Amycolatopsis acididurans]
MNTIAELVLGIGRKYEGLPLDDLTAAESLREDLAAADIAGLSLPEEYGGSGTLAELCQAIEAVGLTGMTAPGLLLSTGVVGRILAEHGTAVQKAALLPGIATGEVRFCFALTEAESGSNPMRMRTTAVREGDDWIIRGEKTYISAVDHATHMLLVTRAADALTLFVVELPAERVTKTPVTVYVPVAERQWTLHFDDLRLPATAVIGEPGQGGKALFTGLNAERLAVAAQSIGLGRWCLAKAVEHARSREVFGVPIGAHQAVQHPLADAHIALESAAAVLWRAAGERDDRGTACTIAKIAACDAGLQAADAALQTFGGSGYTDETQVYQRFAFLRLAKSIPVTRELALNHVATAALGLPRSY